MEEQKAKSVAELAVGESGVIQGFSNEDLALKLLEMGCLPGETVTLNFKAPLGDPISIRILDYDLSIRMNEAASITLEG